MSTVLTDVVRKLTDTNIDSDEARADAAEKLAALVAESDNTSNTDDTGSADKTDDTDNTANTDDTGDTEVADKQDDKEPAATAASTEVVTAAQPTAPAPVVSSVEAAIDNRPRSVALSDSRHYVFAREATGVSDGDSFREYLKERLTQVSQSSRGQRMNIATYRSANESVTEHNYEQQLEAQTEAVDQRISQRIAAKAQGITEFASVGYCGQATPVYQWCPVEPAAGLLDYQTFTMPRAGIRVPSEPNVQPIWENANCMTEADEIGRTDPKPCFMLDCPTWEDIKPCLMPVCFESDRLTQWAFPEYVDHALALAMRKYEEKINANVLASIKSMAQSLDLTAQSGRGMMNDFVSAALFAAFQLRRNNGLAPTATVQVVAPDYLAYVIASDMTKRAPEEAFLAFGRNQVESQLAKFNIDLQWVYRYEDADASGIPSDIGGGSYLKEWPNDIKFLMYRPQGIQVYRENVVSVSGEIASPSELRDNRLLNWFVEEAIAVRKRCWDVLEVTIPLCPSGVQSMATIDPTNCGI